MVTYVELVLRQLRYRWIEYLLGALVIAAVTGALILQRSLTSSVDGRVHDLAHKLGRNMLVVPETSDPYHYHMLEYGDAGIPEDYPDRIRRSSLSQHVKVGYSRLNGNVTVRGMPFILVGEQRGTNETEQNMSLAAQVELGQEAAERLQLKQGDQLRIGEVSVEVIGVRESRTEGLGMGIFTSLQTAQSILKRPGEINVMRLAGCWCRLDVPTLAKDVEKLLPGTRAITVAGVLKAQKGTVATMKKYSIGLYVVGLVLIAATVLFLISSQVRRSLREIGLLLAVGMSGVSIQALLVINGAVVGTFGGILGYLVGIPLTTKIGSTLLQVPLETSSGLWLPVITLCIGASVLAAFVPAYQAARLDPTQLLREE